MKSSTIVYSLLAAAALTGGYFMYMDWVTINAVMSIFVIFATTFTKFFVNFFAEKRVLNYF